MMVCVRAVREKDLFCCYQVHFSRRQRIHLWRRQKSGEGWGDGVGGAEFWMNKWGRWRNKKKIQRWWKVPCSFKCANMRFSVGTATGQATYLLANPCDDTKESSGGETPRKPDRRWYQQQKQYSTSEGGKKRTGLNSKISVRWQIGLFAFRYWHC